MCFIFSNEFGVELPEKGRYAMGVIFIGVKDVKQSQELFSNMAADQNLKVRVFSCSHHKRMYY